MKDMTRQHWQHIQPLSGLGTLPSCSFMLERDSYDTNGPFEVDSIRILLN